MAATMPVPLDYSFDFYPNEMGTKSMNTKTLINPIHFPSPPASTSSEPGLDFDLESFTHASPDSSLLLDDTFNWDFNPMQSSVSNYGGLDASPTFSAPTSTSTRLFTPHSSISSFADVLGVDNTSSLPTIPFYIPADTAEALSNHHLQRYLHYKHLATQAEADARASAAFQSQQDFEALLATCSMPQSYPLGKVEGNTASMLGFQAQPDVALFGEAPQYFAYNPLQQANLANAQAEAHLIAHDVAAARAEHQRSQTGQWVAATQSAFGLPESAAFQPSPMPVLESSPSNAMVYPPVPQTIIPPSLHVPASQAPVASVPIIAPTPMPISVPSSLVRSFEGDGEEEMEGSEPEEDASMGSQDVIPNLHGGGRGYIPGQTPDDPKKRHKCNTCGRAFARAFNLKVSHFTCINLSSVIS